MKTLIAIVLLTLTTASHAIKLRSLAITPERLKLIQENSQANINYQKIEDTANETPAFKIKARNGSPAYRTTNSKTPSLTIDRTTLNSPN